MNKSIFALATCKCERPETFTNGALVYCRRCWLQVPAPEIVNPIDEWIKSDIQRGYTREYLDRQYGKGYVRRLLERWGREYL